MRGVSSEPRNIAILFADVSGSTSLYETLGDQRALATVDAVIAELRKAVALQQGRVIKTIGDEVMAALPTADAAMQAACDMQHRVTAMPRTEGVSLAIRVGFHFGPALEENNDVFGDAVNTAARMAGLAKGGQIITSGATMAALSPLLRESTRDLDAIAVKGKHDEIRIFEVLWQDSEDLTTMAARTTSAQASEPILTLQYKTNTIVLGAASTAASLGRDATNEVAVADRMASRVHARIEYRRGKFILTDQSTNGTFVTVEGDSEMQLKREQFMLRGRGFICLGHTLAEAGAEFVTYVLG